MSEKIGFIGLGIMGKPMAKNLINAGYNLVVLDELVGMGAEAAASPAEVAAKVKKIITMLPDGPEVEEVVLGANGVIENAGSETAVIDMSSISP
ncbi:NAD(P)-binding domain-containing protein, partial [Candidatus Latescibacterota bacterium]